MRHNTIPWAYKEYKNLSAEVKDQLTAHIDSMEDEDRDRYIKYLITMCGYPKSFY